MTMVTLYERDFQNGNDPYPWRYYPADGPDNGLTPVAMVDKIHSDGSRYLSAEGPVGFWNDRNHISPGVGICHLLAFNYYRTRPWCPIGVRDHAPVDLRDGVVTLDCRLWDLYLPPGASLVFWTQTQDYRLNPPAGKAVNYANVAFAVDRLVAGERNNWPKAWTRVTIPLKPNDADWKCYGSRPERAATYGCSDHVAHPLSQQNINCGFHILLNDNVPPEEKKPPQPRASGAFHMRYLKIEGRKALNPA